MQQRSARELLSRYLSAVEGYLPRAQRADITAELSDSIQSRMEEREAELGHPLDLTEQAEIIKTYGAPAIAASRYAPQQQLIGPLLLPYYWYTLKIVVLCAIGLDIIGLATGLLTQGDAVTAFVRVWGTAWLSFFLIVGIVTTIFALLERFNQGGVFARRWDPRALPKPSVRPVPRATSAVELVLNAIFVLALLGVPGVRSAIGSVLLGLGGSELQAFPFGFAPVWQWGILALVAASTAHAVVNAVNLVRPDWARLRAGTFVVTSALGLAVTIFIIQAQPLLVVTDPSHAAAEVRLAQTFNTLVVWSLAITAAGCAATMLVYLRNFVRLSSPSARAASRFGAIA